MTIQEIEQKINQYKTEGKSLFLTSSFQTHSIPLLHIISKIDNSIPVYFNNTGFHFAKLMAFRDKVGKLLDLQIIDTQPIVSKSQQLDENGQFLYTTDPDKCCYLNKVKPMENVMAQYDIWINGVRADQSETRAQMKIEQEAAFNTKRFHPLLNWTKQDIYSYIKENNLPENPLETEGYFSIGCAPCTVKTEPAYRQAGLENGRDGRWAGLHKTECGLHTELMKK